MADFSVQIANYKNYGTYNYKFDNVGNEILNPSSSIFQQVYFALPFANVGYDNSKLLSFYDPTFKEFIPFTGSTNVSVFPQEAIDEINAITYDNIQLQNQLKTLIDMSEQDSGAADVEAVRNIIIGLRIQLGQGIVATDFDTVFPYSPIPQELKDTTTSVQVVPSSALTTIQPTVTTTTTITSNTEQPTTQITQTTPDLGEMTDSEKASILTSSSPTSGVNKMGTGVQYVFVSKDFGSTVINGVTYWRLVFMDITPGPFGIWKKDLTPIGPLRNQVLVYGKPIHGQYVNVTDEQYKILSKKGRVSNENRKDDVSTGRQSVVINGVTYVSAPEESYIYWPKYDEFWKNGGSYIQNYERYNATRLIGPNKSGYRWDRRIQTGYMGALGPP